MRSLWLALVLAVMLVGSEGLATGQEATPATGMTIDQAVALALQRNRDVLATRLDMESAQIDHLAASIYPNPVFAYTAGNFVVGHGNPQDKGIDPGPFSQLVHTVSVSEVIDVWAKRSARMRAADKGIEHRKWVVEDALREIVYAVRAAFADLTREQLEAELARSMKARYDDTIRVSVARFRAGEISEAELRKIELEGLRYENAVIDEDSELDISRQKLAALLGFNSGAELPGPAIMTNEQRTPPMLGTLVTRALQERPDLRAASQGRALAEATLESAKREAYPDISLGVAFTHSEFQISGDNPNAAALTLSLPLPVFDRNQANIARSHLDARRFDNDVARLAIQIRQEVAQSVRQLERAASLLDIYEAGGMLDRADKALKTAENSYRAGSISLIELLEAQRTFIDTRAQYLRAQHDYRQAVIDVAHVTGRKTL
jgi:cobalt-zinc-cadmium efflux system outer membrane protein